LLDEADHLLSTFNALLRISRIEAEKQRSQFKDVDLKTLLEDVIAFYEPLAEDENITFTSDLSEGTLHGDRDLLFQAFANLLDNAVKFTPTGGRINISLRHNDGHMRVEVSDTGIGVPSGEHDKIFNRFYRAEQSRNSAGTGLGLSLVNAVMNLHDGCIQVEDANPGLRIITIF
jgi:signal transduction histidine kinase